MIDSLLDFLQIELRLWFLSVIFGTHLAPAKTMIFNCIAIAWFCGELPYQQMDVGCGSNWLPQTIEDLQLKWQELTQLNSSQSDAPLPKLKLWDVLLSMSPQRHLTGWIHPGRRPIIGFLRPNFASKWAAFTQGASRCVISISRPGGLLEAGDASNWRPSQQGNGRGSVFPVPMSQCWSLEMPGTASLEWSIFLKTASGS